MWVYSQSTGQLWDVSNKPVAIGYSGFGEGKNNPAMQGVQGVGPIPQGGYTISDSFDSAADGPVVMRLKPDEDTQTFGRSGFLIHGESALHPGCSSHGCLILSRAVRLLMAGSSDKRLYVQA